MIKTVLRFHRRYVIVCDKKKSRFNDEEIIDDDQPLIPCWASVPTIDIHSFAIIMSLSIDITPVPLFSSVSSPSFYRYLCTWFCLLLFLPPFSFFGLLKLLLLCRCWTLAVKENRFLETKTKWMLLFVAHVDLSHCLYGLSFAFFKNYSHGSTTDKHKRVLSETIARSHIDDSKT